MKIQIPRAAERTRAHRSAVRLLSRRDLERVLLTVHDLHDYEATPDFALHAMTLLLDVVPAQAASFNRLDMRSVHLLCQGFPDKSLQPLSNLSRQNFLSFQDQHPFVSLFRETGGFAPTRTSDLMSQKQFERLAIYNEYYRRFGARFLVEFTLPAPRGVCLCFVLDRAAKDFSERDRAVLTLLRPHVAAAYRAAQTRLERSALEKCTDPHLGVAFLDAARRVRHLTPSAANLLAEYFPGHRGDRLPEEITRWVRHQQRSLSSESCLSDALAPLTVVGERGELEVQAQTDGTGYLLLLHEHAQPARPMRLTALGLTPRQAEVLYWIAQGKTNPEIGTILGASRHTIHEHGKAIFAKLGVENRAAAMLHALEVLGLPAPGSRAVHSEQL